MFKKLIQKLLGTEMVEVTYRVTDVRPGGQDIEPVIMKTTMLKYVSGLSVEDRLPGYGHWCDIDIISVKDV
ncbi:hypothetical protein VR5_205 [Escherichia phage vb_EcoM-VR5]|uniref:Uncharacterized protein n=1 Tax=Escherichia phage vb_EcoM-VR5 TaxID=1567026 RepID=A0A0A7HBC9_9CAUD|nr:hypothetical protein AVV69_gp203 [Escherichia phage vb_EcoM-VR5]AIZ01992.1 hypothetical protein VR5_205 [Escherichia phage vb_EcoM-VR5]UPW37923.1 site-specific RNA endonuclease [Escherichia phage vB_EcoM_ESCO10]